MSHRIDAILFDLGGVLIELAGVEQMLAWSPGLADTDELWRRWLASPAVRRYERGRTSRDAFAAEVIAEFGLPVDTATFLAGFAIWPRTLFAGATDLLVSLAPHYRLASVSNTNEFHWSRFEREWALGSFFHANFPSFAIGKLKPDAEYFEHVLASLDVRASRTLFIDDSPINVAAAGRVGVAARRAIGIDGARATLAEFGLLR